MFLLKWVRVCTNFAHMYILLLYEEVQCLTEISVANVSHNETH